MGGQRTAVLFVKGTKSVERELPSQHSLGTQNSLGTGKVRPGPGSSGQVLSGHSSMNEERNIYICTNELSRAGYLARSVFTVMVQEPGGGAVLCPHPLFKCHGSFLSTPGPGLLTGTDQWETPAAIREAVGETKWPTQGPARVPWLQGTHRAQTS